MAMSFNAYKINTKNGGNKLNIVLASASPRRKELLEQMGLSFEICPSEKEEVISTNVPKELVRELSQQKARDIAFQKENSIIIGADTIVSCNGIILGKPKSKNDAFLMLKLLEGKEHEVFTGVTLIKQTKEESFEKTFIEETKVSIYSMTDKEIESYIETNEPMDKAGSYGIQGKFGIYIKGISGDYNNVVGLPIGKLYHELQSFLED